MILAIRSGAPARPAPEAGDADPTHGSSDSHTFLQSEIGGLRAHGLGNRVRIRKPCAHPHPFAHTEKMILLHFPMLFEGFWETVCGQGNRLRWTMSTVEMAPAQTPDPSFLQGF